MKNLIDYIQEGLKITKDTEIDDFYDTPGVYAYFKDGYMTDDEDYIKKHKKDAIGVAVISEVDDKLHRIVLDKTDVNSNTLHYGGFGKSISGATITTDGTIALKDMNGKANTIAISKACRGYLDDLRIGSVADDCKARFNGKGYLPSIGEWQMLYDNKSAINKMMAIIGGTDILFIYWSSTLFDKSEHSWNFDLYNGDINFRIRDGYDYVRAVMEI